MIMYTTNLLMEKIWQRYGKDIAISREEKEKRLTRICRMIFPCFQSFMVIH